MKFRWDRLFEILLWVSVIGIYATGMGFVVSLAAQDMWRWEGTHQIDWGNPITWLRFICFVIVCIVALLCFIWLVRNYLFEKPKVAMPKREN